MMSMILCLEIPKLSKNLAEDILHPSNYSPKFDVLRVLTYLPMMKSVIPITDHLSDAVPEAQEGIRGVPPVGPYGIPLIQIKILH